MPPTKDFATWNTYKQQLHMLKKHPYYKSREVWFCSLGINIGTEQDGKNSKFERPVLIVRRFNHQMFWGVPLSTKLKPNNPHYYTFEHQGYYYSAITSQLRLFDSKRLTRKLYTFSQSNFSEIQLKLIKELAIE